ncbi:unnamed protein product [Acanthosepion pharaonis]|uniref:Uncharacterized protein n=1 Tax=Acanthosepion pharaonis TaxID=158019 RepID=A0A812DWW9_ACAPH|nr:unnamed protein product [Sepia pharaonis]
MTSPELQRRHPSRISIPSLSSTAVIHPILLVLGKLLPSKARLRLRRYSRELSAQYKNLASTAFRTFGNFPGEENPEIQDDHQSSDAALLSIGLLLSGTSAPAPREPDKLLAKNNYFPLILSFIPVLPFHHFLLLFFTFLCSSFFFFILSFLFRFLLPFPFFFLFLPLSDFSFLSFHIFLPHFLLLFLHFCLTFSSFFISFTFVFLLPFFYFPFSFLFPFSSQIPSSFLFIFFFLHLFFFSYFHSFFSFSFHFSLFPTSVLFLLFSFFPFTLF